MKILDNYIAKTVVQAIALVTLMLMGLQVFILLVTQLDDLGKADYGFLQALGYVLLQLPHAVYLFFPIASLLGCLVGLGILANHRELVVMRASGVSVQRITLAVVKVAMVLVLLVTILGEMFIPSLSHYAAQKKITALSGGSALYTARGVWLRKDLDFIHIDLVLPQNMLQKVYQFHFDSSHSLQVARLIGEIKREKTGWMAYDVKQTVFSPNKTASSHIDKMAWDVNLNPQILSVSSLEPEEMSLLALHRYLRLQQKSHQNTQYFQLAYWQRIFQPLNTLIMMVLAIPFIFGPLRESTMGARLLAGACAGFGFYIVNKFFGPVSFVLQWPAFLAASGPTVVFAILSVYGMRRVK